MRKYLSIARVTFLEYFAFRTSFILWRLRVVIGLLITFFLWSSLFEHRQILFGYTGEQMITYILLANFISTFSLGTRTYEITDDILSGKIINIILKPVSFFKYHFSRDFADKLTNLFFATGEIALLIFIFKPPLFYQTNLANILLFILFVILGSITAFFINISVSFISFWTTETWAPKFIFYVILSYLSGAYFPLDILPKPLYYLLLATPLPYFYYLPTKIYIKGFDQSVIFEILVSLVWIFLSYLLAKKIWNKGLRSYNFFGR